MLRSRSSVLLALTALLAACSAPAPQAPIPSLGTLGSVYQLDVRVASDSVGEAAVQRVSPSTLSAQALNAGPGDVQLGAQPITTVTFLTRRGGVDVRHISTSFLVTNTTGADLANLTLLPVILSDTDGDPRNNATAPTVAGTPYRRLRLFDGQDASAQAGKLRATSAQQVDLTTGQPSLHPQATPYLRGLPVSGVQAAAPAGLSMTVMPEGWLVAGPLARGASVPVTFAVDLPVDAQKPDTQVYSFSLMFTTAQDVTGSAVGRPTPADRLDGQLSGQPDGLALPLNSRLEEQYPDPGTGERVTVQTTPITADGQVNLTLSIPPTGALSSLFDCDFTGNRSQPDALGVTPHLQVFSAQGDPLGTVSDTDLTSSPVNRLYVDRDIRVQGTCHVPDLNLTYQDHLDLKRGWNFVQQRTTGGADAITVTRTSVPDGSWTRLTYAPQGPWVQVISPAWGTNLTLQAGQSVSVPFDLRQGGGVSGPVTLETDLPGVTVLPSALTLPGLNGQALTPAALQTLLTFQAAGDLPASEGPLTLTFRQNGAVVGRTVFHLSVLSR